MRAYKVLFALSGLGMLLLLGVRAASPELVVASQMGFLASLIASGLFFFGLADYKNLPLERWSPGRPLVLISSFLMAIALVLILGLQPGWFSSVALPATFIAVGFLIFVGATMIYGWWYVLTGRYKRTDMRRQPSAFLWVPFVILMAYIMLSQWLE